MPAIPSKTTFLPPLATSGVLRMVTFTCLYFAQGLPIGFLGVALPASMAERGLSPGAIGSFIAVSMLPWTLKPGYGPIMDRWTFLPMGRRRPWVLAAQAGVVATSVVAAMLPDPFAQLGALMALVFALNFFIAFQDIAVDGMAIEIVPVEEQGRANGFMLGGRQVGAAVSAAGGAWMIHGPGFGAAMLANAALVGSIMLLPLLARERPGERLLPWSQGAVAREAVEMQMAGWGDIGRSLLRVFLLPLSIFSTLAIFTYSMARSALGATAPVLAVQELGWTDTGYAQLQAATGLVCGILGMSLGGYLIDRIGRKRAISAGLVLVAIAAAAMGAFPRLWPIGWTFPSWFVVSLLFNTFVTIAFYGLMMSICWKRVGATQFALYMTIHNMGLSAGPAMFGMMAGPLGYPAIFFVGAALALVSVGMVLPMSIGGHERRLAQLDAVHVDSR